MTIKFLQIPTNNFNANFISLQKVNWTDGFCKFSTNSIALIKYNFFYVFDKKNVFLKFH